MKKSIFTILALASLTATSLTACSEGESNNSGNPVPSEAKLIKSQLQRKTASLSEQSISDFVSGQYDLNFDLIRASESQLPQQNAMISTYSIQTALAMTWAGAAGDTASEMASALRFDGHAHEALNQLDSAIIAANTPAIDDENMHAGPIEISTSNNLYIAPSFSIKADYLNTLAEHYGAGITELDFAKNPDKSRLYINKIVSDDTHKRIRDLLPQDSITDDTQLVITNAIYFNAPWAETFKKSAQPLDFNKIDNVKSAVDAIESNARYPYMATDQYKAVTVPLRDKKFSVLYVLPAEGEYNSVMTSLNGKEIQNIFSSLKPTHVSLQAPSFSYRTTVTLKEPLQSLGMKAAFDQSKADFSGIAADPSERLYISDVYHQTFIGLDEKGIEAAAATAVVMNREASVIEDPAVAMILDRPYFFVIYESSSRSPLFVGRVMDPKAAG